MPDVGWQVHRILEHTALIAQNIFDGEVELNSKYCIKVFLSLLCETGDTPL